MKRQVPTSNSFPERMEIHENANWYNIGQNHKTTLTMGLLVPFATKEVYPGEKVRLRTEVKMRFAPLYLPIMHQCQYTIDWFYVRTGALFDNDKTWQKFITEDPMNPTVTWAYFDYTRANATWTDGVLNYMGFNAPPGAGTLILSTEVSVIPVAAYVSIWNEYYRNDQIQGVKPLPVVPGANNWIDDPGVLPSLRALRRNWPRDYYTSATPAPQTGANVLIPSFATDPETGEYIPQNVFGLDGSVPPNQQLKVIGGEVANQGETAPLVIQLSSTIRDFRYAAQMTEFLERHLRAGDRYNDQIERNFGWTPNPLYIDRPVWIGGYSGDVVIQEVLSTAEVGGQVVGDYAGQALAMDGTPYFEYQVPDFGLVMCMLTVYPKASYYSGQERMWRRVTRMDYMWEQFALIGDQPLRNKEVWFSWYDADIAWNDEIFGYVPQYAWERYSNDVVSGQMRTLWEGFHMGRKFSAAADVVLNDEFITCTPDIGRVFVVDAEAGEHECYVHGYNEIQVLRKLPKNALPAL